jgi:purine-binding chemotaxis protein CheW
MSDYVTFRLDGRSYATRLEAVREVVRLAELVSLPGMVAPLSGVLDLRGASLPVVDIRAERGNGDVLVLAYGDEAAYGFVCDAVDSVVDARTLPPETSRAARAAMPGYVQRVLRGPDGPVFLVDVNQLAGSGAADALRSAGSEGQT